MDSANGTIKNDDKSDSAITPGGRIIQYHDRVSKFVCKSSMTTDFVFFSPQACREIRRKYYNVCILIATSNSKKSADISDLINELVAQAEIIVADYPLPTDFNPVVFDQIEGLRIISPKAKIILSAFEKVDRVVGTLHQLAEMENRTSRADGIMRPFMRAWSGLNQHLNQRVSRTATELGREMEME